MPSVCCSAPCAYRTYNKYRQRKDGTYELNKMPGAGGKHGTCQHSTMIKIDLLGQCLTFEHWNILLEVPPNKKDSRGK